MKWNLPRELAKTRSQLNHGIAQWFLFDPLSLALSRRASTTPLQREFSLIETRIGHLVEAVKRGEGTDSLLDSLQAEEHRMKLVLRELAGLADQSKVVSLDAKRMAQDLRTRAADVRGLLGPHIPPARQMLRKLILGRLECEPFEEHGRRGYRLKATGTYGGLLAGAECVNDGRIPLGPPPKR